MPTRIRNLTLAAWTCVLVMFPCRAEVKLPDPAEGNVNGLQGVIFVPETLVDGENRLVDPTGCVVYLVPSDVGQRFMYDCGKWFAPPAADRYTVWLEQGQRISEQTVLIYPRSTFANNGHVTVMSLESAGFAALPPETSVTEGQTVRFLSLEPSVTGFDKRLQAREAKAVTRLPAGRALSGIFDADGNAVALSRPFTMNDGKTIVATPTPPVDSADLMIILGKHQATVADRAKRMTSVNVAFGEAARAPDVMYETDGRIIAIWYGLTANSATLKTTSGIFQLADKMIPLSDGKVTTIREQLGTK